MRKIVLLFIVLLACRVDGLAFEDPAPLAIGTKAPDFSLPGTDGKTYSLADFAGNKALLIVFTCNHCPYAQGVEDRLIKIGRDYQPHGLAMALISSNDVVNYPEDSFENM